MHRASLRIDFAGGWSDSELFTNRYCGYVSSITIHTSFDKEGTGLSLSTRNSIVNYLKLVKNFPRKLDIMAEKCYKIEEDYLLPGRQDSYAIVFGGFNCFRFYKNTYVSHKDYKIPISVLEEFKKGLTLFHMGEKRNGKNICEDILKNDEKMLLMRKLAKYGLKFAKKLKIGNFVKCAYVMSENWEIQKQLASCISTPMVDKIYDFAIKNGALGGKLAGAGGGGVFIFYSENKNILERKLKDKFKKGQIIRYQFEYKSLKEIMGK